MIHANLKIQPVARPAHFGPVYEVQGAEHIVIVCCGGEMAVRNRGRQIYRGEHSLQGITKMQEFLSEYLLHCIGYNVKGTA